MLRDPEGGPRSSGLSGLRHRRGHAQTGAVEGERTPAHREGQREQARACSPTRHGSPGKQRGAPRTARPKGSAFKSGCEPAYMPIPARSATCAPTPKIPAERPPPRFSESYARCRPSMPRPTFAPTVNPTFDSVLLTPDSLRVCQRLVTERYGSMLTPGDGTLALMPAPAMMFVRFASKALAPVPIAVAVAPPSWMFRATGSRLPPMTRNAATPPVEVRLSLYPWGFQVASPAVRLRFTSPRVARAPHAVPSRASVLGLPKSPLIVTPVPPLGLFQTGIPSHCAAAGAADNPARARRINARFMCLLPMYENRRPASPAPRLRLR